MHSHRIMLWAPCFGAKKKRQFRPYSWCAHQALGGGFARNESSGDSAFSGEWVQDSHDDWSHSGTTCTIGPTCGHLSFQTPLGLSSGASRAGLYTFWYPTEQAERIPAKRIQKTLIKFNLQGLSETIRDYQDVSCHSNTKIRQQTKATSPPLGYCWRSYTRHSQRCRCLHFHATAVPCGR